MAENKTQPTDQSVQGFLDGIADERKRTDAQTLLALMQEVSGEPAAMWGTSMIGFGSYHYKYPTGREGDMFLIGFAPRKDKLVLYHLLNSAGSSALLEKLGKHSTGKGCLYIKRLSDIDTAVLRDLVARGVEHMRINGTEGGSAPQDSDHG